MTKRNFTWWLNTFVKLTSHNQRTFQILLAPCNPPGFPANGNGQWRDLKHNSWVTFSCNKKYQLEGRRQIQCKDGIWSGNRPKCVGKKIRIRCSFEFWFIWKRIFHGAVIKFECNKGYKLRDSAYLMCKGSVWEGQFPECEGKFMLNINKNDTINISIWVHFVILLQLKWQK